MSKLVIVESPGKIKKIKSYLGSDYIVMASIGHIRDLDKSCLSIDTNNNFNPTYQITDDKKAVVKNLRNAIKDKNIEIIIASDGDREGEAIAYHLVEVLGNPEYKRIIFHEITKTAILNALTKPTLIDMNMFYAQQTRRLLDRITGYKLSPILKQIPNIKSTSLGAGRVQSVVTRLIVDKEREIENFVTSSYYCINGDFIINKVKILLNYVNYDFMINKKYTGFIKSKNQDITNPKTILLFIKNDPKFTIKKVEYQDREKFPVQPFTTSSLQQEASYKLKFNLKKTMMVAQKLYEKGLITYMRTDSPSLSNDALSNIKKQILEDPNYGEAYYQFRQFKTKNASAQEAHEAIRPTHFNVITVESNDEEDKLYQLIWKRTVASQMKPAIYHDQHITLVNQFFVHFEGTNSELFFDGYLKLYMDSDTVTSKQITIAKNNIIDWSKIKVQEKFHNPPQRYNEPSLVKKLEGLGIGRPSTYASIVSKIQEHKYVQISNCLGFEKEITIITMNKNLNISKKSNKIVIGLDKLKLVPTEDGTIITDYLVKAFPQILDYKMTSKMESLLDDIAEGKVIWYNVLKDFYDILKKQFLDLGLDIESKYSSNTKQNNNIIIGKYPKFGNIEYLETKYGPAYKLKYGKKDIFIGAKNKDLELEEVIKLFDYKIKQFKKK